MGNESLPKTPLEELSEAFTNEGSLRDCWEQKVVNDVERKVLYIVPAGFSQNQERKECYKAMWQKAASFEAEKKNYPFGTSSHAVILRPEPKNPYDKHAIQIGVQFDDYHKTPTGFRPQQWQSLGYVPKVISRILSKNFKMLKHGRIFSVHSMLDRDLYYSRVIIPYNNTENTSRPVKRKKGRFHAVK